MRRLAADIVALYGRTAPARLIGLYHETGGPFSFLGRYWTTQHFSKVPQHWHASYASTYRLMGAGMLAQVIYGLVLIYLGSFQDTAGAIYLGVAVIVSYPLVWAHILFMLAFVWTLLHPKRWGKAILCIVLERQVKKLRRKNKFTIVAVAGSVGKTSTKLAIAKTLAASKRVRYQEGNYNDRLTVPLVLFNAAQPAIFNVWAWLKILAHNHQKLKQPYPFDIAVVELGTDGPGQMRRFAYLKPELGVLTGVTDEHMEQFGNLDNVAKEELTIFNYCRQVLVNVADTPRKYLKDRIFTSYDTADQADYSVKVSGAVTVKGQKLSMNLAGKSLTFTGRLLGQQGAKITLAAAAISHILGMDNKELKAALTALEPVAGRLQRLKGSKNTIILDDTYNASPTAVKAALDVLYQLKGGPRIAILGGMNELGDTSKASHKEIGSYCDAKKLKLVVTIGAEAKQYLAPAAKKAGCTVKSFLDPREAGEYVKANLKPKSIILGKGSQNGVFAEEAVKVLLANPKDADKLVRQSRYWMQIKHSQFGW
ncbi:UDP-N-acetylmuramoyl-tripeptide--D-alanyl-D-alanine ligase [Candidatus Saccharibacteria bacterium]|nr:UDP-N-acetylmuramoyl-tripeptide--D-alanyl-D-alanine ligase [Candidatus Saccharibacteria bacterium]